MNSMFRNAAAGCALAALLAAYPVAAHHSTTMFDHARMITINGIVKEVQWTNPHIWVQVLVKNPATGQDVEWSIEGASPNALSRQGWSRNSLKAGDQVEVVIHPLKNGDNGGSLIRISVDGKPIGSRV